MQARNHDTEDLGVLGVKPPLSICLSWLMISADCHSRLCMNGGMVLRMWEGQGKSGKPASLTVLGEVP